MKINRKCVTSVAILISLLGAITCAVDHEYLATALWLVLGVGNDLLIYKLEAEIELLEDLVVHKNTVIERMLEELTTIKGGK